MVLGSSTSHTTARVLCAKKGSMKAVSASGSSTMSDSLMPFQPAMEEPSNILPSSKVPASMAWAGKVTWCCTPRMSAKRRSTNSTDSSWISLRTLSTDIGFPCGG